MAEVCEATAPTFINCCFAALCGDGTWLFFTVVDEGRRAFTQPTSVPELWKSAMRGAFDTYRLPQNAVEVHAASMRVHLMATKGGRDSISRGSYSRTHGRMAVNRTQTPSG